MATEQLVLIVDDDPHIREVVRFALGKGGFRVIEAEDGRAALELFAQQQPDLIILDIMLQEMDGTDVCRAVRSRSGVPIIFLSSKDDEIDRIVGLELGGDDYVTKPFSPRELVARVKAVLRRGGAENRPGPAVPPTARGALRHGLLRLDLDKFQIFWGDIEVGLTLTEFGILRTLAGYPGKVFTRDELISGAYAFDNHITDRTIDSHVRRIRRKFGDVGGEPVETMHGVGYKLGPCS
jgi:two-component system, OmpR family, response regulator